MRGQMRMVSDNPSSVVQITLDYASGQAREARLFGASEFPRVAPQVVSARHRKLLVLGASGHDLTLDSVNLIDTDSGKVDGYAFGAGWQVEEHVLVPRRGARSEPTAMWSAWRRTRTTAKPCSRCLMRTTSRPVRWHWRACHIARRFAFMVTFWRHEKFNYDATPRRYSALAHPLELIPCSGAGHRKAATCCTPSSGAAAWAWCWRRWRCCWCVTASRTRRAGAMLLMSNLIGLMIHAGSVLSNRLLNGWPRRARGLPRVLFSMALMGVSVLLASRWGT
jgi:hypothetical protein